MNDVEKAIRNNQYGLIAAQAARIHQLETENAQLAETNGQLVKQRDDLARELREQNRLKAVMKTGAQA